MINTAYIETVDISNKYFHINLLLDQYIPIGRYFEKESEYLHKHNELSFDEAVNVAKDLYKHRSNEQTELYISKKMLYPKDITNNWGDVIFSELSNYNIPVWLIFFDPCRFANWGHKCEYTLIQQENVHFSVQDTDAPSEDITLTLIQ
ncbi:MAG: hypothetical protein J1F01_02500 [Oscillospiraceae bacterium]|nr:hypothetical protein [Oscillospiraceae bacterium]